MEFWGAEVQAGKPITVKPEEDTLIHISQASIECKGKKGESTLLFVKVDGKKLVMGTLSQDNIPQISFDLVFEKEFELSHNLERGSVHFIGYKSPNIEQEEGDYFSDSEEEEEEVVPATATATTTATTNGNSGGAVSNLVKAVQKQKAKPAEVKPESDDDDDDSDEEDESEDDASDSVKGMCVDEDDSDDEEESEDEEEETPKMPELGNKKRANESASKTHISAKKAKPAAAATPQKTEEKKKGGHTATPHPARKGGKSPVNANQSPKSGAQSFSGSNKKPFNSGKQFGSNNKGKGRGKGRA